MYLRTMPRVLSACLAALCLLGGINCRAAEAPQTSAESFVLIEAQSGRVLASRNAERELAIASTTKIMTALVAMEEKSPSETVSVKEKHLKEGSSMYLRAGETLTLEDLLYGLLLPSGNDAAECIADYCGGGVEPFVRKMNEKAAALGMSHTAFANPSGLDAEGHYSCALDMARLAAYAMCQPLFVRIASTKTAAVGERMLGNHNKLLASLSGCVGVKTGYTSAAGRTRVTCCERDGLRLIAVTLNDRDDWNDHAALYEYGFSAYARRCAVSRGERYARIGEYLASEYEAQADAILDFEHWQDGNTSVACSADASRTIATVTQRRPRITGLNMLTGSANSDTHEHAPISATGTVEAHYKSYLQ